MAIKHKKDPENKSKCQAASQRASYDDIKYARAAEKNAI